MEEREIKPNIYETYIIKAEKAYEDYDIEDAIKYAKLYLKLCPDASAANHILMDSYYEMGEFNTSLIYCDELLKTEFSDAKLYARKGFLLSCLKEIDYAVECYDKAIELNPNYYDAICDKGKLLSECVDCDEEALTTYKQAILLDPNKAEGYFGAASVYQSLGDMKKAVEFSSKAHMLAPDDEFITMHAEIMKLL